MVKNKVHSLFIIISIILLIIVLGFTGVLNILSFHDNYSDSLISSYAVLGMETVGKIEYAIKYGKPLDSFWGMDKLLQDIKTNSSDIETVQIVLTNGQIIYNQEGPVLDRFLAEGLLENLNFKNIQNEGLNYQALVQEGKQYLFLPILNRDKQWSGSLNIIFASSVINTVVGSYLWELTEYLALVVLTGLLVFVVVSIRGSFIDLEGRIKKKRFLILILSLLGFLQIIYGFLNYNIFKNAYLEVAHKNTNAIINVVQKDVNSVLNKGISYNELYDLEGYLKRIKKSMPEIENIFIISDDSGVFYSTQGHRGLPQKPMDSEYSYYRHLLPDMDKKSASVWVHISPQNIKEKMQTILFDTATVFLISFLFMVEAAFFVILLIEKITHRGGKDYQTIDLTEENITIVRYLAFLIFAAVFLSTTFIPILMNKLYQPLLGLPKNVVLGLPISVEMLFGALSAVRAGYIIERVGCKPVLTRGLVVLCLGALFSAVAWDAFTFIGSRAMVGAGFGFALMALRIIVISTPDNLLMNRGIASMNSGAFAGVNCGVIMGGMLADRIGYSQVFFFALFILVISWVAAKVFLENIIPLAAHNKEYDVDTKGSSLPIFDKNLVLFFLLILVPVSVCGMFLHYIFPIYAESMGVSSSNVGRAFLLNGLIIIFLGPVLSRFSEKHLGTRKSLVLASLLMGLAMLIFAWRGTMAAALATVIMLGFADSFGVAAQSTYFLRLPAVFQLGQGKAIAYFSIIGKLGQMLGPMVFGSAAVLGITQGTGLVGLIMVAAFLLFAKLSNNDFAKKQGAENKFMM